MAGEPFSGANARRQSLDLKSIINLYGLQTLLQLALGERLHRLTGVRVSVKTFTAKEINMNTQPGVQPDRIDINDPQMLAHWAQKLDTTEQQLRDAIAAVGDKAADIEMHLKGSHSTTNADRMNELGGS